MNRLHSTIVLLITLLIAPIVYAGTIEVTTTADEGYGVNGDCSLRQAGYTASGNHQSDCPIVDDGQTTLTIHVHAGVYNLTIGGLNFINAHLKGDGAETTIIDGANIVNLTTALVVVGGNSIVSGVTIQKGNHNPINGAAGGILAGGTVTLKDCIVTQNKSFAGAGIYLASGNLTVSNCIISKNSASSFAGGIYVGAGATSTIDHSIISDNSAVVYGSAIYNSGTLSLMNSTVSGSTGAEAIKNRNVNSAAVPVMIISRDIIINNNTGNNVISDVGKITIVASTIFNNSGGITLTSSSAVRDSTVINNGSGLAGDASVGNSIVINTVNDCASSVNSLGHNLFGSASCTILPTDKTSQTIVGIGLGDFVDDGTAGNGHFPLLDKSLAIGAADPLFCTGLVSGVDFSKDQLGNPRKTTCDIGAIETPGCDDEVVQSNLGEECDTGTVNSDTGACLTTCKIARCGDGKQQTGVEQCDDGNSTNEDGCSNVCKLPSCGDAIVQKGEECDIGATDNTGVCLSTCQNAKCGDGFLEKGVDECDDVNLKDGDGCSAVCKVELKPMAKNDAPATPDAKTDGSDVTPMGTDNTTSPGSATTPESANTGSPASSGGGCTLIR